MARKHRVRELILDDPMAMEALASPHRLEVVAALGDAEQASIADLARRLGRTPHSLYYHVKLLEEAGVVVKAETRRRGRRDERVWKLVGERMLLGAHAASPEAIGKAAKAIDSMLRLTSRELCAALRAQRTAITGLRMKARLDQRSLGRVARLIREIEKVVADSARRPAAGRMFAVTLVVTPTEDKTETGGIE